MSALQPPVKPLHIQISFILCAAVFLFSCSSAVAQSISTKPRQNKFEEAKRIIVVLYPELSGKHLSMTYSFSTTLDSSEEPATSQFDVLVSQFPPGQKPQIAGYINPAESNSTPRDVQMTVGFWFDNLGQLERFTAQGHSPNDDRNKAIRELVDAHPDWADTQITDALKAAGAKFDPSAKIDLMLQIPADRLSSIFGKCRIVSTEFEFRDSQTANNASALMWHAELEAESGNDKSVTYHLIVEPFGGKVTFIQRSSRK
jgi:hypothetical protein